LHWDDPTAEKWAVKRSLKCLIKVPFGSLVGMQNGHHLRLLAAQHVSERFCTDKKQILLYWSKWLVTC
jgi:hypothetical protein